MPDLNVETTLGEIGTPPVPPEDSGQVPAEAEGEESATSTPTETPPEQTEKLKGAEPSGAEKRIKQLVAQNREMERQLAYLKGAVETIRQPQAQAPVGPPTLEQFDYDVEKHQAALRRYDAHQAIVQYEAQKKQQEVASVFMEETKNHQRRMEEAAEIDPDIITIANDPTMKINEAMSIAIIQSPAGPQVIRYLHEHRNEMDKINRMTPYAAMNAINRIETNLTSVPSPEPPKKISQAPEPITTVGNKGTPPLDEESLPIKDWIERRNKAQYRRR